MDSFDLRPLLAQGVDPLTQVIERARAVGPNGRLVLEAPFNPLPLRRVLAQMGFSSTAEQSDEGHWRISCHRDGEGEVAGGSSGQECQGLPDVGVAVRREADGLHIDVRGLQPPTPMLAILRLCAVVEPGVAIIVHHDRDPLLLYPELAEIGWSFAKENGEPGEVRLRLFKEAM